MYYIYIYICVYPKDDECSDQPDLESRIRRMMQLQAGVQAAFEHAFQQEIRLSESQPTANFVIRINYTILRR